MHGSLMGVEICEFQDQSPGQTWYLPHLAPTKRSQYHQVQKAEVPARKNITRSSHTDVKHL